MVLDEAKMFVSCSNEFFARVCATGGLARTILTFSESRFLAGTERLSCCNKRRL
jgi:hypothetical protein